MYIFYSSLKRTDTILKQCDLYYNGTLNLILNWWILALALLCNIIKLKIFDCFVTFALWNWFQAVDFWLFVIVYYFAISH